MARLDLVDEREIPTQCSAKYVHAFSPETSGVFAVTQPCYLDEDRNWGDGRLALASSWEFEVRTKCRKIDVMITQPLKCLARIPKFCDTKNRSILLTGRRNDGKKSVTEHTM